MYYFPEKSGRIFAIGYGCIVAVSCCIIEAVSWLHCSRIETVSWPYRGRIVAVSWPYRGRIVAV